MKRRDFEEVRKIFVNAGLTLLDDVYKSVDAPMKCADENGYLFSRSLRTVEDNYGKNKKYQHYFSRDNFGTSSDTGEAGNRRNEHQLW